MGRCRIIFIRFGYRPVAIREAFGYFFAIRR
jgi:hypothetical protein